MKRSFYILTFKKFTKISVSISLAMILSTITINYYVDPFGLHGNSSKERRVYINEKTTKYLHSFNYIPNNFNGILVGSSISDQMMNTRNIDNYKIYNMSMDAANISELKFAIDNVFKYGDIKALIIGLDPYITRSSGTKSSQIDKKEYYGTLGSLFIFKYYFNKYIWSSDKDNKKYWDSYWGYIRNDNRTDGTSKEINDAFKKYDNMDMQSHLNINNIAFQELSDILDEARAENIKVLAYFHPLPKKLFNHKKYSSEYKKYRKKIETLLDRNYDIIVDFNKDEYNYISGNDDSYIDSIHLSEIGANKIISSLSRALNSSR
jgi:hypothetical protein